MKENSLFEKIDKAVFRVLRIIASCGAIFLLGIMVIAFVNVILEKLHKIGVPVTGIADTANWIKFLNVGVVYLAAGFVTLERGHSSMDLVTRHYPKVVQRIIDAVAHLAACAVLCYITYLGYSRVLISQIENNARINDTLASSAPQWPFGMIYMVGMGLLAFSFFWGFIRICFNKPAASDEVDPEAENQKLLAEMDEAKARKEEGKK